eukprot:scaffold231264_cov13-Tisochrysis_lutea.AAC.1
MESWGSKRHYDPSGCECQGRDKNHPTPSTMPTHITDSTPGTALRKAWTARRAIVLGSTEGGKLKKNR